MADDLAMTCCTSATLDCKKLERRVEKEGVSFLTITLPAFAKDFERSLDQGFVDAYAFPGFTRKGGLPLFLGGFLRHVFDSSGVILAGDSDESQHLLIDSIFAIRQLTRLFSKILLPCSDARLVGAMKGYVSCEQELQEKRDTISEDSLDDFRRIASLVFPRVFSHMDNLIYAGELRGKHGPGATADRLTGNGKFDQQEWPLRLEKVFPAREHLIANWSHQDQLDRVQLLEPDAERPVKVISVPKTLKTPRIIAIEPTCMQYMQQAMLEPLVQVLEPETSALKKGRDLGSYFLGFRHQDPNRDLARRASRSGDLATLDLSEASDRVLNKLVLALLHRNPLFSEAVQATRSTHARVLVRNEEIVLNLNKFASMGSALTFPIEAMVFLVVVLIGIEKSARMPLTYGKVKSLIGSLRIYGDDIIVPVDSVPAVIASLEAFGFKVNSNKSFWTGKFRESCGGEYYDGFDVTPVKFTRVFPTSRRCVEEMISLVEFRNHVYHRGLWETARYLDEKIRKLLPHFPIVEDTSSVLGRSSLFQVVPEQYNHGELQRSVVKAFFVRSRPPSSRVSGDGALLKFFLKRGVTPSQEGHLERSGRAKSSSIKLGWMSPYSIGVSWLPLDSTPPGSDAHLPPVTTSLSCSAESEASDKCPKESDGQRLESRQPVFHAGA